MLNLDKDCVGLVFGCSKGKEENDCPFKKIRLKDKKKRIKWWSKLSEEKIDKIINHHNNCSYKNE